MSFIPDEQKKTVKIPIQVRNGRIQFYFHGPLPDLKEGIIGDIRAKNHVKVGLSETTQVNLVSYPAIA
jgi:hypothetical protein